jgi:hypothetical protein
MAVKLEKKTLVLALGLTALAAVLVASSAGDMEPWASPASTFKSLHTIEPRQVIWGEQLTAEAPFVIFEPGSYYLGENIDATGKWGIEIAASNVTVDLNGFALTNGWGVGIRTDPDSYDIENVVIRDGTISGWDSHGIDLNNYKGSNRVSAVIATGNGGIGIRSWGQVVDCIATGNGADGIFAAGHSIVRGCRAFDNDNNGIQVGAASSISNSVANNNRASGIRLWGDVLATGNVCVYNDEAGIRASNTGNRIDGNQVMHNSIGIDIVQDGTYSQVMRNSAWGNNLANYAYAPGVDVGPIGAASNSTSPWANFED